MRKSGSKPLAPGTRLLTYDEARKKLGVGTKKTFFNLINRGTLKPAVVRVPGMRPKIREDVLNQIIEEHTEQTVA